MTTERELTYARQQQNNAVHGRADGQCECGAYRLDGARPILHDPFCGADVETVDLVASETVVAGDLVEYTPDGTGRLRRSDAARKELALSEDPLRRD